MSGREKGAVKTPFPHNAEGGQICVRKGLVPGDCKKGKTLGGCSHHIHSVAKSPGKRRGTEMLLLPGVGVRVGLYGEGR